MAENFINRKPQLRGTAAAWTSNNTVLLAGEWGLETDTNKAKYGDGVTAWNDLPYFGGGITTLEESIAADPVATSAPTFQGGLLVGNAGSGFIGFSDGAGASSAIVVSPTSFIITAESGNYTLSKRRLDPISGQIVSVSETGYNALTNNLNLSDSDVEMDGFECVVEVAGTRNFGSGNIVLGVGDVLANNGSVYYKKVDNNQSGGGGGGSSPLTTKGDLYTYTTENARLPIGTDDQVLIADSTTSSGLRWGNASSASLPWIDITQAPYNAVADALGDAGVDSTTAWNDALDDLVAAGGGVLYIPYTDGTRFNITPETATTRDYSNITIMSFQTGNIFVKDTTASTSQGRGVLVNMDANTTNFEIKNLDILVSSGAFRNNFQTGVICSQVGNLSDITLDNLKIRNEVKLDTTIGVDGITFFRDTSDPLDADELTNLTIKNCDIELYGKAIYGIQLLRKTNNTRILNSNVFLHANSSETASAFNAIAMYGDSVDFLIDGCIVYGSGHSGIAVSTAVKGQVTNNKVYNVMYNQSNATEGGIEVEYKAGHGDNTLTSHSVIVANNYVEHCKYGILITERDDDATTLGVYDILISNNIIFDSSNIDIAVFSDLTLSDRTSVITGLTIDSNICRSTSASLGISIYDAEDCSITNNKVYGQTNGIRLGRSATLYIKGNFVVSNNLIKDITNNGFWVESGVDVNLIVKGNMVEGGNYGYFMNINIDPNNISTLQMIGNFAKNQVTDGFFVKPSTDGAQIIGNTALSCGAQGFDVAISNGLYTNNTARSCTAASNFTGGGSVSTNNKEI